MTAPAPSMRNWKITGIMATLVIILALPLHLLKEQRLSVKKERVDTDAVAFVGSEKCKECHQIVRRPGQNRSGRA